MRRTDELAERVFRAAASRDLSSAVALAREELANGQPVGAVLTALAAAQVEVGERWYADEWSVADEHAATAVIDAALAVVEAAVHPAAAAPRPTTVVVACPEGEWHALPARMLAAELRLLGAEVVFLGASMPADHLARFVDAHRPDLVALSVSTALSLGAAAAAIDALHGVGAPVVLGGRALGGSGRRAGALGADGWSADAAGVLAGPLPALGPRHAAERRQEREVALLELALDRPRLLDAAMDALADRVPGVAALDDLQLARTREDLEHVARFAEASILADDPALFEEFLDWLVPMLVARGVPARAVRATLDTLVDVVTDERLRSVLGAAAS